MNGPVRVWPRQALVAEHVEDYESGDTAWIVSFDLDRVTDAEFAAHFVPADRLDRLLAAVAAEVTYHHNTDPNGDPTSKPCNCELCAAWRAYRGDE